MGNETAAARRSSVSRITGVPDRVLQRLRHDGDLLVPRHISWRRAAVLVRHGYATLYPFHQRWLGKLDITPAGRTAINGQ